MIEKIVNCSDKDKNDNILWVGWVGWYDLKDKVILNIESWKYKYLVFWAEEIEVYQRFWENSTEKYIRTKPNNQWNDNLGNLNRCLI